MLLSTARVRRFWSVWILGQMAKTSSKKNKQHVPAAYGVYQSY